MNDSSDLAYNVAQFALYAVEGPLPLIHGRILVADFAGDKSGRFRFGERVVINSSVEANPIGGILTALVFKGPGALIEVGDGSGMSNVVIAAYERVTIGRDVNLGAGCKIIDTDFHSLDLQERIANVNIPHRPVTIEDGAFIGTNAMILKGVTVGRESIIAAGAVVVKSVPPGEIWGGNPARFIRKLRTPVQVARALEGKK
jgi:acetyltransferase-like isoleucine patch superfamily enzyme